MIDISQLGEIATLAGNSSGALKSAVELVKSLKGARAESDDAKAIQQVVGELANELYDARIKNLEMVGKLQEFLNIAERENTFADQVSRYAPFRLPDGGNVLKLKLSHSVDENWEFACPTCATVKKILMPLHGNSDATHLRCESCKTDFANNYVGDGFGLSY